MDVWEWYAFWPHDLESLAFVVARGLPFSVAHAIGNVALALAAGPELRRLLDRYGRRLHAVTSTVLKPRRRRFSR
jgi:hypothetical protein